METLTVTLKTVTPLFLGGACPNEQAELRPPSIKGALRFWYRAIDPQYNQKVDPSKRDSPTWEQYLFGSADSGQAGFLLRVGNLRAKEGRKGDKRWHNTMIAYLGFGPIIRQVKQSVTTRSFLESGAEFTLRLVFKNEVDEASRFRVERALWALLTLGGLGARSRKGFGSLMVTGVKGASGETSPWRYQDRNALVDALRGFLRGLPQSKGLPEHTSWSQSARCIVSGAKDSGEAVLEWLGKEMHSYRSFRGEKKFVPDHDNMVAYLKTGSVASPPKRAAFGLPHNYFFTQSLRFVRGEVNLMDGSHKGRRASPLLLHVQALGDGTSCIVATFLPARLIPPNRRVQISGNEQPPANLELPDDFSAVTGFLDRLAAKGQEVRW